MMRVRFFLKNLFREKWSLKYESKENEFLVIADSWHPNWRAQIDSTDSKLIRANGVFKGVLLPPGSHKVRLFFDSSAYVDGVWISIFGWSLFIISWGIVILNSGKRVR